MNETIFIDGVPRRVEWVSESRFYADTDELPNQRCSCHTFKDGGARLHLNKGGAVLSGGHHYTKHYKLPVVPTPEHKPPPMLAEQEEELAHLDRNILLWALVILCLFAAVGAVGFTAGYLLGK